MRVEWSTHRFQRHVVLLLTHSRPTDPRYKALWARVCIEQLFVASTSLQTKLDMVAVDFGWSLRKFTAKILMKMADSDDETSTEHEMVYHER